VVTGSRSVRPDDVQRVADEAFAHFGTTEVVVNNAGYGLFAAVEEPTREQIRAVLDANLVGSIDVIRAALPHLRARGGGRIVQVSSVGGRTVYPGFGYHHAAWWGIEGFCETLAVEMAPFGTGVTIVEPGVTPTGFSAAKAVAPTMPEYDTGALGGRRRAMAAGRVSGASDPAAVVRADIAGVDDDAPLRLPLGADTHRDLYSAYSQRLELLEASRELALSVTSG
jgi:NAD(P)-dependent dehydrogenase (short-subunit alcohol dehydrogenase family)